MTRPFKPMLASPADLDAIRYPIFASPKLDGIRASVVDSRLLTRTLKEVPSRHVFSLLSRVELEGLDGELIVGAPTHPACYRNTVSMVMAHDKAFPFTYHVFDLWNHSQHFYQRRLDLAHRVAQLKHPYIELVPHAQIEHREQLDAYEAEQVALGHEGIMLADPHAHYKFGRATTMGGELLKVKRFEDSEAVVIGVEEEMFNGNEAQTNELGRTKRSTAKDGLIGKGTTGALIVRDVKTGVEFNIGTGFTAKDRAWWWNWFLTRHEGTPQPIVKYKSFNVGVKDKPRHPVYLGLRPVGA
jgi:DNA ligase-1